MNAPVFIWQWQVIRLVQKKTTTSSPLFQSNEGIGEILWSKLVVRRIGCGLDLNLKIDGGAVGLGQGSHIDNTSQNYRFMKSPFMTFTMQHQSCWKKVENEKECEVSW